MTAWEDVIKLPSFQELEPDEQVQIRAEWYDANVTPKYIEAGLTEEDFGPTRQKDILEFDNGQGYVSSFANSVARGALGTVSSAIQGAGALSQDQSLEEAGTAMQQGVESTFGVNPSMTKTNFAGEVVGNVGSMLATGGAGGLIGKGLGVAARGAEVGSLGTGFLAGAGQGAQEADQYGITGEDRVARAFLGGAAEVVSEKIPGLGMGTELRAISKIPGLSEVAGQRAGGFVKAVGSEAGEEVISQGIGNLSTNALVAPGVQGPDLTEGFGEAAIGGALGGGIMGGIGLIGPSPSERAISIAEQRNDPGAKAALEEARKLVPIIAPEIAPPVEGDTTALDPYEPDLEKFAAENPVLPFAEPATTGLVPGAAESGMDAGAAAPGLESGTAAPGLVTESPASGLDTGAAEPAAPVEVAPAGPTETAVPEVLTAQAEAVLPTPEVTEVTEEQLREEERLIDPKGRITEETGVKMAEALKTLGVSTVDVIFNDTGKPPDSTIPQQTRGGRYTVNGKEQVYLNRNLITKDTPVHEIVGHGVIERLGELMPDLDAQARAILTGSPLEAAIKARYDREGIQLDPEALFREAKATLIGNQGADVFEAYANNGEFVRALKEWWAKFREWMDGFLASKGIDPNMPLEQFAKKVNRLILAGKLRDVTTNVQQEENRQENDQGQKLLAFSESLLESLPERARAAWSPEDLAAADRFAETGDRSALSGLNPVKQKRAMEHRENLRKPLEPQFSLKPSGLAANQPGTKVRAMAAAYTYQTESAGPAFDQAEKLYREGGTFEQQFLKFNELLATKGTNGVLSATPWAYGGLMIRDLTIMRDDPDALESEVQRAERSLDRLMAVVTESATQAGQNVQGIDLLHKIGNSPAVQVRAADKLVPFDGSPEKRKEFDNGANVITTELDSLNQEALTTAPEAAVEAKIGQGVADVIRGQDAADAGAVQLDIAAEQIDEQAMPDWYLNAISQADASVRTTVEALMEEFMLASLLEAEGDFSLTPGQEANKAIRERALARLAAIRASGKSKATALEESKKRQAELARKLAVKPKAPTPSAPADESDVMAMAVDRAVKMLTQLTSPAAKPKQASTNKLIAKAVTDSIFAKIGLIPPPAGTADSMATTVGLLLANQDIAASLVQDTMARIQQDPAIAGLITLPKLKAFFQATIGKEFTTVDGTTTSSAPYGEKQIADLLRAELKAAEVSLNKVVMDAALQRQTADQLEAQLRDPKRSFAKVLSPEAIDKMVAAVRAEFERTARQRADRLAREQAEESVRMRMEEDQRQQREFAALEERQAADNARIAQEEVRKAMQDEAKAEERWRREQSKAAERVRADAKKAVLKAMRDYKAAQDKQAAAAQRQVRDAMAEQARAIRKDEAYRARLRRDARRKAFRAARRKGLVVPLEADEIAALKAQPNDKIVDYLAREFGFNVADVAAIPREADRYATLEAMTIKLADTLGLDKQQSEALLKPVIAEAMKTVDAKRKAQVKKKIEDAVRRLGVKTKKDIPTEAQKLIRLAELGGLTAENVEVLLLDTLGAEKFSKEFKDFLVDLITKANDPNLPQASRDQFTAAYLNAIRSARGVSAVGLAGEWVMSNIFMSLNTFKVNALWGGIKAIADSAVFLARFDPGNVAPGAQLPKGARQALVRQMLRGFNSDLQYQSKYILKTGMSKLESDFTTQFSNSDFELLAQFPDTEIRAWLNGKPISKPWSTMTKKMAAFSKWTRRIMVATDIVNRTPAYEMLKANAIIKFIAERGTNVPTNAREWQKAIDDALYGGDFKAARDEAWKEVEAAIADGRVAKQERGIYFGEVMDRMLARNLGLNEVQLNELLARAQESAKRWTVANATEGILGGLSNAMLAMVRDVPGLKFLLPAIRMPIGAFSQGLDWSPYGFLRYRAIKSSGFRTASFTNIVFNKSGKRNWNQPAAGIPEEQAIDTLNKAFLGSAMMLAMAVAAAASFDDDEDEADFYITGKGPEDPQRNRLWRDKGNKPFMVRIGGFSFNYQESPMYPMLTTLGAWSDSHRYGKPEDTESDRLLYAFSKSIAGFGDAAVLKSFQDALAAVSGGSGYTAASASEITAKTFGRLASVVVAPRVGNEINTILYGPQDQKEGGWAARMLANVPFVPAVLDYPALNWFGEEITVQRGGPAGELLALMSHRVSPQLTDDPQMRFVVKIGANKLTTTRRTLDGVEVMDQPALVRQWAQTSGAAIRQWLTPERMAQFEAMRQKDVKTAEEAFDKEVRRIREEALRRVPGVVF